MSCHFCKEKCNTCVHLGEEIDYSDSWDAIEPNPFCNGDGYCEDYEKDGSYCKMCDEKLP